MKSMISRIEKLTRFYNLAPDTKEWLSERIIESRVLPGQRLIRQGDFANIFYVIESGYVKWERESIENGTVLLDVYGRCETPGELAININVPYPASGVALTSGVVFRLSASDYREFQVRDPGFAIHSSYCIASRAYALFGRIEQEPEVERRLAGFLLRLVRKFGVLAAGGGVTVPFTLPRKDYSNAVNCRVETAIRTMSHWKKRGWVDQKGETILVSREFIDHFSPDFFGSGADPFAFGGECDRCRARTERSFDRTTGPGPQLVAPTRRPSVAVAAQARASVSSPSEHEKRVVSRLSLRT